MLVLQQVAFAQSRVALKALVEYENNNYEGAIALIDSAVVSDGVEDPQAWHIRGFIYKDYYKNEDKKDFDAEIRKTAIASFYESNKLDSAGEFTERNKRVVNFISSTFQNDAVQFLNKGDYNKAMEFYELFKEVKKENDPNFNFRDFDIEFTNGIATVMTAIYESNPDENEEYFDKAINKYKEVLEIDSLNFRANLNIGVMYYNLGVDKIKNIDPDEMDIFTLHELQDECIDLFRSALPYMKRAYEIDPKRREVVSGLSGIYFSLDDKEKFNHYSDLLEELDGGEDE